MDDVTTIRERWNEQNNVDFDFLSEMLYYLRLNKNGMVEQMIIDWMKDLEGKIDTYNENKG